MPALSFFGGPFTEFCFLRPEQMGVPAVRTGSAFFLCPFPCLSGISRKRVPCPAQGLFSSGQLLQKRQQLTPDPASRKARDCGSDPHCCGAPALRAGTQSTFLAFVRSCRSLRDLPPLSAKAGAFSEHWPAVLPSASPGPAHAAIRPSRQIASGECAVCPPCKKDTGATLGEGLSQMYE